jgi:protocatechuate 3,4-dioxygenase beta subunit
VAAKPAFKDKLNRNYRVRALDSHLRSVPIFRNLSRIVHRAPGKCHFASVLPGHLDRQLDAMDRRREA